MKHPVYPSAAISHSKKTPTNTRNSQHTYKSQHLLLPASSARCCRQPKTKKNRREKEKGSDIINIVKKKKTSANIKTLTAGSDEQNVDPRRIPPKPFDFVQAISGPGRRQSSLRRLFTPSRTLLLFLQRFFFWLHLTACKRQSDALLVCLCTL